MQIGHMSRVSGLRLDRHPSEIARGPLQAWVPDAAEDQERHQEGHRPSSTRPPLRRSGSQSQYPLGFLVSAFLAGQAPGAPAEAAAERTVQGLLPERASPSPAAVQAAPTRLAAVHQAPSPDSLLIDHVLPHRKRRRPIENRGHVI